MAFDQKTRNLLQRTVTACRRVFDREFTAQLQELYGIQPDGTLAPCEALDHLADEELEVARLLRSRINHLEGGEPAQALTRTQAKSESVARLIREQAFTVLNRLAALRLCEERGLVLECVRQGVNSEGFQLFMTTAGNALGETHEAYRVYLHCLFDELALDLGVLFDRFSPLALLFPRKDALEEVLRELNGTGKAAMNEAISAEQFGEIWKADEAIGWIYQYYNDEAERKKMRELSSAPRNSRELAVRNQFFTPRYVVEFLTDNTLGRLWYEMTRSATALRDRCAFLVRRPTEIFLKAGEAVPASVSVDEANAGEHLSQEELLRQPVYILHRPLKDPREIRLLDPACGSMHFGLYAFDVLTVIYDEAWEIAFGPDGAAKSIDTFAPFVTFAATFSDKAAFLLQVPRLIIEHNIHGIDIDPRAAQIAGLSLWLRAQRAWHQAGIRPADRPRITRSNIVCAEPMPGEKKLLSEFVEQQFAIGERPAFAFLLEKIFDCMTLAGEAGSLLRIEEEIRSAIAEASVLARSQPVPRQPALFGGDETPEPLQLELRGLVAEHFWHEAEQRIYDALEAYAEQAENDDGFQRRLFADDAAQGFAFIDLCRKRYDVVVMNPPFGLPVEGQIEWLKVRYGNAYVDLYSAMVLRGMQMSLSGLVGSITSRSFMFAKTLTAWRETVFLANVRVLADLGTPVMDNAMVESCAYVLAAGPASSRIGVIDCRIAADKGMQLCETIRSGAFDYLVDREAIGEILGGKFLYSISGKVRQLLYRDRARLGQSFLLARQGLKSFNDSRFMRLHSEVAPTCKGRDRGWEPITRGGGNELFYADISSLVLSENDGQQMAAVNFNANGQSAQSRQASRHYRQPGATYTWRAGAFKVAALPSGVIIGGKGPAVLPLEEASPALIVGLLCSSPMRALVELQANANQYETGIIESLPVPILDTDKIMLIERATKTAIASSARVGISVEASTQFWGFRIRQSLQEVSRSYREAAVEHSEIIKTCLGQLDAVVSEALGLTEIDVKALREAAEIEDCIEFESFGDSCASNVMGYCIGTAFGRWDVRCSTGERSTPELLDPFSSLPVCPPGMLQNDDGLPLLPEAGRKLRTEGRYPLDVVWDGILVDDPESPFDLERRVQAALAVLWADRAGALEQEACALLGVPNLRDWFRRPSGFFADHLKLYSKSRRQAPIYWPLSTANGSYTLWLYYHRLTPDTLYKCLQQFVVPKLADVEKELTHLRTMLAANEGSTEERRRLEELEGFRRELIELRTELELWAPKWKPNLNDGVLINAAPLWKLFRLPKWQKDLKACWQELEKGDYDWAHLANSLWPDRVREKCKTDRSLAIAHGLEEICDVKAPVKKVKKTKKTATKDDLQEFFEG